MSAPGRRDPGPAAALPVDAGARIPTVDELRHALHPAALPLPTPRTPVQLAQRIRDLIATERRGAAERLLTGCAHVVLTADSTPAERLALLRAAARLHRASGERERLATVNGRIITLLRQAGHRDQAETVGEIMSRGLYPTAARTPSAADPSDPSVDTAPAVARTGRRTGTASMIAPAITALARGLAEVPAGAPGRPRADLARLDGALEALPAAQHQVLGASKPLLLARRAQLLLGFGRAQDAARDALDVLELLVEQDSAATGDAAETTDDATGTAGHDPVGRAERPSLVAHAVLARALREARPLDAAHHAICALEAMDDVDDPRLRIELIIDLLKALVTAELHDQASFTAGRLASLQRTLPQEQDRAEPLLAVAAQRLSVGRLEAALVPLTEARRISREHRDVRSSLTAARLAGRIHQQLGDASAALAEHRRAHREARRLVDDLATPRAERAQLLRTELESAALVLRHALELGDADLADQFARIMLERTGPHVGEGTLSAALLWDHRVDAAIGRMLAAGLRAAPSGAAPTELYEARRTEAMRLILDPPPGPATAERVRFWSVYHDDRHALVLAQHGHSDRALAAARRARDGWTALGEDEHVARLDAEIDRLEHLIGSGNPPT